MNHIIFHHKLQNQNLVLVNEYAYAWERRNNKKKNKNINEIQPNTINNQHSHEKLEHTQKEIHQFIK